MPKCNRAAGRTVACRLRVGITDLAVFLVQVSLLFRRDAASNTLPRTGRGLAILCNGGDANTDVRVVARGRIRDERAFIVAEI